MGFGEKFGMGEERRGDLVGWEGMEGMEGFGGLAGLF